MEQISKRPSIVRDRYRSKYTCFEKFIHSINAQPTKSVYTRYLKGFMKFSGFTKYEELVDISDEDKYNLISDYIIHMKEDRKVSYSSINSNFSAIKKFFASNNIQLPWDQLKNFNRKKIGKVIDDRVYTKEEIIRLLDHSDLRMRVIVLTLLSTGMRAGGLAELKYKDLEYIEKYGIYKITVYSYDIAEKYVTFCTPECAEAIQKYLKYRESIGDIIKPESPIIYRKLVKIQYGGNKREMVETNLFNDHITSDSLQRSVSRLQHKSKVTEIIHSNDEYARGKIRKAMMRCHAFRKIFNSICIEKNVNHYVKERLLGHKASLGLDMNYMRDNLFTNGKEPDKLLLSEYLKVIDDLTVSDENKLKRENRILKTEKQILKTENESFTTQMNKIILELHKNGMDINI